MTRKARINISVEQKLEYAKMMIENGYSVQQIIEISGAGATAVRRWKKQYLEELQGITPEGKKALTADQQKIHDLEKQLRQAKRDNEILKKAAAFFAREGINLN